MSAIRSGGTKPELVVRKIVSSLGYRYRLHYKTPFGRPDLTLVSRKKAIFVHGCFWHRHRRCRYSTTPSTNTEFWSAKFKENLRRDRRVLRDLVTNGWAVLTVWECETRVLDGLTAKLTDFLKS